MRSSPRPYLIAIGIFWAAPLLLMLAGHVFLPDYNADGQCTGLGFGCVPAPSDGIVLWWVFTLPFTFTAGVVCLVVIALVRRGRRSRPTNLGAADHLGDRRPGEMP